MKFLWDLFVTQFLAQEGNTASSCLMLSWVVLCLISLACL